MNMAIFGMPPFCSFEDVGTRCHATAHMKALSPKYLTGSGVNLSPYCTSLSHPQQTVTYPSADAALLLVLKTVQVVE